LQLKVLYNSKEMPVMQAFALTIICGSGRVAKKKKKKEEGLHDYVKGS